MLNHLPPPQAARAGLVSTCLLVAVHAQPVLHCTSGVQGGLGSSRGNASPQGLLSHPSDGAAPPRGGLAGGGLGRADVGARMLSVETPCWPAHTFAVNYPAGSSSAMYCDDMRHLRQAACSHCQTLHSGILCIMMNPQSTPATPSEPAGTRVSIAPVMQPVLPLCIA